MCISVPEVAELRKMADAIRALASQTPTIQAIAVEMAQLAADPTADQDEQEQSLMVMHEALFPVDQSKLDEEWDNMEDPALSPSQGER